MSAIGMPDLESCESHGDYTYLIGGESTCPVCKSDKIITDLQSKLTEALNRVKELEVGLMPFAKEAWSWEPDERDSYVNFKLQHPLYGFADNKSIFTLGDLRRAAELLKDREPK